jgi:hypothetical protein
MFVFTQLHSVARFKRALHGVMVHGELEWRVALGGVVSTAHIA